MPLEYW